MKVGTSLRFFFPAGPQTLGIYQRLAAAAPPGLVHGATDGLERRGGTGPQPHRGGRGGAAGEAVVPARRRQPPAPPAYGTMFQPVPTIARLSAETGPLSIGMVLLAPFYHPLLLAEQIGTLSAFVDAPLVVTFAAGGNARTFEGIRLLDRLPGPRTEDVVPVVRALLAGETVSATGRSFQLAERNDLTATPPTGPTWIAGTNEITVERAGRLGDGWLTAQNASDAELVATTRVVPQDRGAPRPAGPPGAAARHPPRPHRRRGSSPRRPDLGPGLPRPRLRPSPGRVASDRRRTAPHLPVPRLRHLMVRHITGDHAAMIASFELLGEVAAAVA